MTAFKAAKQLILSKKFSSKKKTEPHSTFFLVFSLIFFFGAEVVTLAGVKKTKGQCFEENTIYLWDD